MAIHACPPVAQGRFVERTAEVDQGGWLGRAIKTAVDRGLFTEPRQGFDEKFYRRATKDLGQMIPMDVDKVHDYIINRGWIRKDKAASKKAGETVYKMSRLDADEAGYVNAVTKVYLEGLAGGVKNLADSFLMKVKAKENATVEGLQLAQQMQGISRLGGYVLGWDQQLGRGLRQSGLIRGRAMGSADAISLPSVQDALGNAGEYTDKFRSIAAKLQGDDAMKQAGVEELIGLARQVKFLDDPHKISKATLGMEIAGNAWQEMFINGLLSSPTTFVTNLLGVVWVPSRVMLQLGAAQAWASTGLFGAKEAQQVAAEASASLAAMYSSFNDAVQIGWHATKTENSLYQTVRTGIDSSKAEEIASKFGKTLTPGAAEMIDWIGRAVRLPSRALLGTDEFAKHLAMRGEVAARSVRRAAREGVDLSDKATLQKFLQQEAERAFNLQSPEQWDKYKLDSAYNLSAGLEAQGRTIAQVMNEATFQEDNSLASGVNNLLGQAPYLRPFVPFVRTPLNILKQGVYEGTGMAALVKAGAVIRDNPTTAVLALQQELLKDPSETFRMAGQIALTTALAGTIYGMAMSGQITGGGPGRWTAGRNGKAADDAWRAAGNVPYSLKVGDQAISFDRFGEPVAIVMRMFADLGMYSAYMDATDQEEVFSGMVSIAASGLYQASFLQGIESLIKIGQEDSDYALGAAFQNYAATQTPFGGLLAFVDRTTDPYKKAYQGASFTEVLRVHEDTFGTGIFGKLANRIPGLGSAPQLVDQLTGNPVPIVPGVGPGGLNPLQMAIPVMPRQSKADEVWQAVWDIRGSYIEKRPAYQLSAKEQQELNAYMASSLVDGKTLAQRILEFRRRSDVETYVKNGGGTLPGLKFKIERELDSIINEHFKQAENELVMRNGDVLERQRLFEARGMAEASNNIEDAKLYNSELNALYQRARRGF